MRLICEPHDPADQAAADITTAILNLPDNLTDIQDRIRERLDRFGREVLQEALKPLPDPSLGRGTAGGRPVSNRTVPPEAVRSECTKPS